MTTFLLGLWFVTTLMLLSSARSCRWIATVLLAWAYSLERFRANMRRSVKLYSQRTGAIL